MPESFRWNQLMFLLLDCIFTGSYNFTSLLHSSVQLQVVDDTELVGSTISSVSVESYSHEVNIILSVNSLSPDLAFCNSHLVIAHYFEWADTLLNVNYLFWVSIQSFWENFSSPCEITWQTEQKIWKRNRVLSIPFLSETFSCYHSPFSLNCLIGRILFPFYWLIVHVDAFSSFCDSKFNKLYTVAFLECLRASRNCSDPKKHSWKWFVVW